MTMPGESDLVDSHGYLSFGARVEKRIRRAVIGLSKDYLAKSKFELDTVERH